MFSRLPRWTLWLWGGYLVAGLFLLEAFGDLKRPSQTHWFQDLAANQRPSFKTFLTVGWWYGTLFHLTVMSFVLATVGWWGRGQPVRLQIVLGEPEKKNRYTFWIALALICIAAGGVRWPKMSLSYWGDEGWAVAPYVYGKHVPLDPTEPQGAMTFRPVSWLNTAFDDRTAGNHYLFSLLQRATLDTWRWLGQLPSDAFDETISRLPPFAAGIGSLIALALMLRWLGRPGAGLAAALLMALHPWHLRYSTEARGYTLLLLFLILSAWLALIALRSGKWRGWLGFGLAQFLCMYSWKGAMYPLAAINLTLFAWMIWGKLQKVEANADACRSPNFWRWLVVNLMAAGLFINLVYPCLLQVKDAKARLIQLSGRPMGTVWLHNSISGVFTGMPWHVEEKENPTEVVLSRQWKDQPFRTSAGVAALSLAIIVGLTSLAKYQRWLALLSLAVIASGIFGAWCFRFVIQAEWISWYFFFTLFPLAFLGGIGIDVIARKAWTCWGKARQPWLIGRRTSNATLAVLGLTLTLAIPTAFATLTLPASQLMIHQAYEDHRGAFQVTRGRHEALHHSAPSKIWTVYLWRYISLYDPRGTTKIRQADELMAVIAEVEKQQGELYVIIGHRRMARRVTQGVLDLVERSGQFQHLQTFWAPEELHCLHCFRLLPSQDRAAPHLPEP